MNFNSIPELKRNEKIFCCFYNSCPKRFCMKETGSTEKKCLMIEREIYHELISITFELDEDYIKMYNRK